MSTLPKNIENDLIDLLNPSISEGTHKNRRNLLVSSFTIVAVYLVGKSLTDLRVFGLSLEGGNSSRLLLVAITIILFWLLMYILHAFRDKKIIEAKRSALDNRIKAVIEYPKKREEMLVNNPHSEILEQRLEEAVSEVEKYSEYRKRLKKARLLTYFTFVIEYSLPVLIAFLALYFLLKDYLFIINALKP